MVQQTVKERAADKRKLKAFTIVGKERFQPLQNINKKYKQNRAAIDLAQVHAMAKIGCTTEEVAALLFVSPEWVRDRLNDTVEFARAVELGLAEMKMSLRRKQYEVAMSGDVRMLIWLGKQLLDQRDKTDVKEDRTVNVMVTEAKQKLGELSHEQLEEIKRVMSAQTIEG